MKSADFANSYPKLHPLPPDSNTSDFATAKRWAALFGAHIHTILRDEPFEPLQIDNYVEWIDTGYANLENRIFHTERKPAQHESDAFKISELTYHALNANMIPLWEVAGLTEDDDPKVKELRKNAITISQGRLALWAMNLYEYRAKKVVDRSIFNIEYGPMKHTIQGRLTEFDATIALLQYIKQRRPMYDLYAAPAQFEHRGYGESGHNIDLILNSLTDNQTVGIQIKSSVDEETKAKYDPSKIVLIDGAVDLGNKKIVKAYGGSMKAVSWGGLVSLAHLTEMSREDRQLFCNTQGIDDKWFMQRVFIARGLLAGTKSYTKNAVKNVGQRVEHYFSKQKVA